MKLRNGRRPYRVQDRLLALVILRQMELMRAAERAPRGHRWEKLLKQTLIAAGFLAAGIGLGRLVG